MSEFKLAKDSFEACLKKSKDMNIADEYAMWDMFIFNEKNNIRKALLLADRLLMEPSEEMIETFRPTLDSYKSDSIFPSANYAGCAKSVYKAMVAQLIKEIETEINDVK